MPTPLHKEIRWHREEIALCLKTIAEVEADPSAGADKAQLLKRLNENLAAHRELLATAEAMEKQLGKSS